MKNAKGLMKIGLLFAIAGLVIVAANPAMAQITEASSTALFTDFNTVVIGVLLAAIALVLTSLGALLGLGFAVRKLRKYVTGKKF